MLRFQFCLDRINRIYKIVFKQASPVLHAKILLILLILSKNFPATKRTCIIRIFISVVLVTIISLPA